MTKIIFVKNINKIDIPTAFASRQTLSDNKQSES